MGLVVSVVICTWNRSRLLRQTLQEMVLLRIPDGVIWEILVVDNGSSDDTARVVASFADRLPVRWLFEPRAGKSYAANTALAEVRGDLLIWTDDDVLVSPDWVAQYVRATRELPEVSFFAGAITPWFEAEPPPWIRRYMKELSGVYVIADYGAEPRPLVPTDGVFGANMAFRTEVARAFPLDPRFGRIRGELPGGDDTDLVVRVIAAGHVGYWLPEARVQHFVPNERMTAAYVWRWYRGSGHTFVRRHGLAECPELWGVPRWVVAGYTKALMRSCLHHPLRNRAWIDAFRDAARFRGIIEEARALRRASFQGSHRGVTVGANPSD